MIDGLLALPLGLLRPAQVSSLRQQLVRPGQQLGVKFQCERGLGVVLGRDVKVVQLVDVAHVQRCALYLRLVKILQRTQGRRTHLFYQAQLTLTVS